MKKFVLVCALALLFLNSFSARTTNADDTKTYYAKIQSTNVQLCSSPSENSPLFKLPYSYFVKVSSAVDDYYKVTYKDVEGYIKKDKVKLMKGTPQTPFAIATFKLFVPYGMYSSPNTTSAQTTQIADISQTINYYGTLQGQQVTSSNNTWYYSSIQQNGQTQYGYIFSGVTDYLSKIDINNEVFDTVSDDVLDNTTTEFHSLSTGTKIMLIVAISLPSVLILYFLIKPSKIMQITKTRKQVKKESRKIRHGDYFEFDESELS